MVPGSDNETLDGVSETWILKISETLASEKYQPRPARRTYIPKSNGKMRPLGVGCPRDKIVQQSTRLVMETILDAKFCNTSHGFRPQRGCHTALNEIRKWKGVTWFIEGDIKGFFDNIDHHILEELLKKHFNEARLIHLYWKFVKAGYIEWDNSKTVFVSTDVGVPQGSILSPLLSNLVLHELDQYMEKLMIEQKESNGKRRPYITNPLYHKLTMRINRAKKKINKLKGLNQDHNKEVTDYRRSIRERRKTKSQIPNPELIRVKYVRYADDWLIGLWGDKQYAKTLKNNIESLLRTLKLELSMEKTLITLARSKRAKFLATYIKRLISDRNGSTLYSRFRNENKKRRTPTGNLWMTAPILEIVKKLEDKGYITCENGVWKPLSITRFTLLPIREIILRYNQTLNGIFNYYSFVDNRKHLAKIHWILKESLRKTISRKYQLNKSSFLKKYGIDIQIRFKKKDGKTSMINFQCPELIRSPMKFLGKAIFADPYSIIERKISTRDSFGQPCANCNSESGVEMHHIKHIKTINVKLSKFDQMAAKINRKQVPLCGKCHSDIHAGRYHGKSLKYLK
uniref:hypothetical protein n=1 Tax=Phyllosticta yuccae TaxID=1151444 RepID=UPI0027A19EFB|nr:hypothetical protein QLP54_mgp36 [Phyllosticta yuccae]WGC90046.1 hypothetical protein [Phyllosticta yuccae]